MQFMISAPGIKNSLPGIIHASWLRKTEAWDIGVKTRMGFIPACLSNSEDPPYSARIQAGRTTVCGVGRFTFEGKIVSSYACSSTPHSPNPRSEPKHEI